MKALKIVALIFCVLIIPGCFAHHPGGFYSPAATGAVVGALVGGAAGYAIGNSYSDNRRGYRGRNRNDYDRGRRRGAYRENGYRQRRGYYEGRRYR